MTAARTETDGDIAAVPLPAMHLNVYFHEKKAGVLMQNAAGRLSFRYDPAYIAARLPPISLNLPVREAEYDDTVAAPYFSSLLPEERMRDALARNVGTSEKNVFALLREVGRECAGAIAFYPSDEAPRFEKKPRLIFLQEQQVAGLLDALRTKPLLRGMDIHAGTDADDDGVRLSLAGAQAKLAVSTLDGTMDGAIVLVAGGAPTTHIVKPAIPHLDDIVANEFFCMTLATLVGIPTARVAIRKAEDKNFLLVERYDRRWNAQRKRIERLHQEDFCQVLGIPPQNKYEKDGGPGLAQCRLTISRFSSRPALDLNQFLTLVIFNYFIGNADAHGKNFSFLYRDNEIRLTPAYDLLCTAIYPGLAKKMAMKIGGHYDPDVIVRRHWSSLMPDNKTAQRRLDHMLESFAHMLPAAARDLKSDLADAHVHSPVFDEIIAVIDARTASYRASTAASKPQA